MRQRALEAFWILFALGIFALIVRGDRKWDEVKRLDPAAYASHLREMGRDSPFDMRY